MRPDLRKISPTKEATVHRRKDKAGIDAGLVLFVSQILAGTEASLVLFVSQILAGIDAGLVLFDVGFFAIRS